MTNTTMTQATAASFASNKATPVVTHAKSAIELKISKIFNGALVSDVLIDDEFGCVTATVNHKKNVDCGFIESFKD